jgi:hypothetical protein
MILCAVLAWSSMAYARYLGPTAHGYHFHAGAIPSWIYLDDPEGDAADAGYSTSATLVVHVRDVNRDPVDGMAVTFQTGSDCKGVAALSATRAVTRKGAARVTLTGKDNSGGCHIAVRVDNVTQEIHVVVNPVPEMGPD